MTTKKIFTKSYFEKLQEKKYEKPTERAAEIIEQAEPEDRLKLKIQMTPKPKVLEASRLQNPEDIVVAFDKTKKFDSEKLN